eukprot:gnl/TRDRNA2_/TRDRNA2_82255_c0_seq2.p1 gnl/TRDRNA2_/TRDRNA2_82255_c0~~gnl/TRDRNA2_/TRDRNA2_82255_c0_seq2.p1  ORF type:complete len:406 (-),score=43.95 gnl/TRDRNA2_/TRDRNA2_82255_c0_seq2:56-1171(-)
MPQLTAAMEQHWFGQTLSIYGEPLEDCRGSDTFADFPAGSGDAGSRCSSRWLDMGLHQVCIPELPANFSTATGQGSWSRSFAGRPWCICVWAYSSYSSQMLPALPLNCAAIPQQVLAPAHAVAAFRRCGRGGLACQPEIAVQSVQKLCSTCLQQAPSARARTVLQHACEDMLEVVKLPNPAAAASWRWLLMSSPTALVFCALMMFHVCVPLLRLLFRLIPPTLRTWVAASLQRPAGAVSALWQDIFQGPRLVVKSVGAAPDGARCRICFGKATKKLGELARVCRCRGSIAAVHLSCLETWREEKKGTEGATRCELCHTEYRTHIVKHTMRPENILAVGVLLGVCFGSFICYLLGAHVLEGSESEHLPRAQH